MLGTGKAVEMQERHRSLTSGSFLSSRGDRKFSYTIINAVMGRNTGCCGSRRGRLVQCRLGKYLGKELMNK